MSTTASRDFSVLSQRLGSEVEPDKALWYPADIGCTHGLHPAGEVRPSSTSQGWFLRPNQQMKSIVFSPRHVHQKNKGERMSADWDRGKRCFPIARMVSVTEIPRDPIFMGELIAHFREYELIDRGDEGRAYSTRKRCNSVLDKWVLPRWQGYKVSEIRTVDVENWLRGLHLARGTKAKIRKTLGLLYSHALRWEFTTRNPISGPVRGSGVRQSEKRERVPEVLTAEEFHKLEAALPLRERVLVCLALSLGLRRGELAGLRWQDIDFEQLTITVQRSLVDQVVGLAKTEASQRPLPMHSRLRHYLSLGGRPRSIRMQRITFLQPTRIARVRDVANNRCGWRKSCSAASSLRLAR